MQELQSGTFVDHFQLRGLLGRGGMGEVWLARDTRLGRRVALKFIRLSATPQRLEAFLSEARHTARFSHPHIVTTYAVGEHEGRPYLALEYVEGESLRQRLRAGRLAPAELTRLGLAVAEALCVAHAQGVLHLDIKPANVMVGADGRPRVLDFGLAGAASQGEELRGTPAYMAPERWQGSSSAASDTWSLGVMLYELCCGQRPWQGLEAQGPEVLAGAVCAPAPAPAPRSCQDPGLRALMEDCLRKEPQERPAMAEVVRRLRELVYPSVSSDSESCPFRGLRAFREEDAAWFFGREGEIARAVERLRAVPTLSVVGASGAGKSSLVAAGIVPRLREQGVWQVLSMRPGPRPLAALRACLQRVEGEHLDAAVQRMAATLTSADPEDEWAEAPPQPSLGRSLDELHTHPEQLGLLLSHLAQVGRCRVLLVVDQLEEVFTQGSAEAERDLFLRALGCAAVDADEPVRVVLTLRDDHLGRFARAGMDLAQVLVVRAPDGQVLRDALQRALDGAGLRVDRPELLARMVEDAGHSPARLPLLQFTARLLWEQRDVGQGLLRWADYERLGGVTGALAGHAEEVLQGLGPDQLQQARELLLRLVHADGTRRPLRVEEVGASLPLVQRLEASRLVISQRDEEGSFLELAHESLALSWPRLVRWRQEARSDLRAAEELAQAARLWQQRGGLDQELWSGPALAEALARVERVELDAVSSAFLRAATRRERRRARLRRWLWAGSASVLVLLTLGATATAVKMDGLRARATSSQARALVHGAQAALASGDPLSARAQVRASLELVDSAAARATWWSLRREPLQWSLITEFAPAKVAVSPTGQHLVVSSEGPSVLRVDLDTREVSLLRGLRGEVAEVAVSLDDRFVAAADYEGEVRLWDLTRHTARTLHMEAGDFPSAMALGPQGRLVIRGRGRGPGHTYVLGADGLSVHTDGLPHILMDLDPEGELVVTGARRGGEVWLRQADALDQARPLDTWTTAQRLGALAFSPQGDRLAALGTEIRILSLDGEVLQRFESGLSDVRGAGWSRGGQELLAVSRTGEAARWSPAGEELERLELEVELGLSTPIKDAAVASEGRVAVLDAAGIHLVDLSSRHEPAVERGHGRAVLGLAPLPDGTLLSAGEDGLALRWEATTGAELSRTAPQGHALNAVAASPDGSLWATASQGGVVQVRRRSTGSVVAVLPSARETTDLAFSPDGGELVTADWSGQVDVWDLSPLLAEEAHDLHNLERLGSCSAPDDNLLAVAFAPDGRGVLAGGGGQQLLWWSDPSACELTRIPGHVDAISSLAAGEAVLTGSYDGTVRRWDLHQGTSQLFSEDYEAIGDLSLSGDGRVLWTGTEGRAWVQPLDAPGPHALEGHRGPVHAVTWGTGAAWIATGGLDGTVRLWDPHTLLPLHGGAPGATDPMQGWSLDGSTLQAPDGRAVQVDAGLSALLDLGEHLFLGFEDGNVQQVRPGERPRDLTLAELPATPVTAMAQGPEGTLFLGHAGGHFGLWDTDSGLRLLGEKLHGPVTTLELDQGELRVGTELGDTLVRDLSLLTRPWEEVLSEVREQIPVLWEEGRVVRADAP